MLLSIAYSSNNMGLVFGALEKYEESIEHYLKAIKLFKNSGSKYQYAIILINLGNMFTITNMLNNTKRNLRWCHFSRSPILPNASSS